MADSQFLAIPPSECIASNEKAFAIWDSFPVNPGHVLVITRRVVPTWFEADAEEQVAVLDLAGQRHFSLLSRSFTVFLD